MPEQYTTDGESILASSYASGGVSITVSDPSSFPLAGIFRVRIEDEILKVTAVAGAVFTVVGAQEGTSAANHSTSAIVTEVYSADAIDAIRSDQSQIGTYASLPSTTGQKSGNRYKCTDSPYEFIFNGSIWVPFIGGTEAVSLTLPPTAGWTDDANNTGSTLDTTYGYLYFKMPGGANTVVSKGRWRVAPSTPYSYIFFLDPDWSGAVIQNGGEIGYQIGFRQSTTGKLVVLQVGATNGNQPGFQISYWTTVASFSSSPYQVAGTTAAGLFDFITRHSIWIKILDDGTNLKWYMSPDAGHNWYQVGNDIARGTFMTLSGGVTGPDQIFIGGYVYGGNVRTRVFSMLQGV